MTQYHTGHHHAAPRRKGDHPSVHHRRKKKTNNIEDIAEIIVLGFALGGFTYLAAKGYLPNIKGQYVHEINKKYSIQFAPIKNNMERIRTEISTKSY